MISVKDIDKFSQNTDKITISNGKLILNDATKDLKVIDFGQYKSTYRSGEATKFDVLYETELIEVEIQTEQTALEYLDLSYNKIKKLVIKNCPNLENLYLYNCGIEELVFEGNFPKLSLIDLSKNSLKSLKITKSAFPELKNVFLDKNESLADASFLKDFIQNEEFYYSLDKCDKLQTPPYALVTQGREVIKDYFERIEDEGEDYLYEAKLLILGDPRAGKTTLSRKIIKSDALLPEEDETTRGIDLGKWEFEHNFINQGVHKVTVNIWDFGGQTIYKNTHRFFLTQRSVYVLLTDGGLDERKADFPYWLHFLKVFAKDSPMILVINEKEYRSFDVNLEALQKIASNLKEQKNVNLKYAATDDNERFNKLLNKLKIEVTTLSHIGEAVPKSWKKIREVLENLVKTKKVIDRREYFQICEDYNVKDRKAQKSLAKYFHDIGVFLFFQEDDVLSKTIFLNKQWILNGTYKISEHYITFKNKGKLTTEEFKEVYKGEYEDYIIEIKALLKKFYLIYEKSGFIVVPQTLQENPPEYIWNEDENVSLLLHYDNYMPVGILWQFMVEKKDEIKDDLYWKYGVVLKSDKKGNTEAVIKEFYGENKIMIQVKGSKRIDFRAEIKAKFKEINEQYSDLSVKEYVPCVCEVCKKNEDHKLFDYEELILYKEANKKEIFCPKGKKDIPIKELLEGLEIDIEHKNIEHEKKKDKSISKKAKRLIIIVTIIYFLIMLSLIGVGIYVFFTYFSEDVKWFGAILSGIGGVGAIFFEKPIDMFKKLMDIVIEWQNK